MTTKHIPEDSNGGQAESDNRLLDANEQLTLRALRSQEQADESERRYLGQHEAIKLLMQKQQQLRSLASELILSEQRQRKHLATELHDYLAQLMVLGGLKVANVRSRLQSPDLLLISALGEIHDIFGRSLAYTRTLMAELSPPVLHELGLPAALQWLAEDMVKHGLTVELHLAAGPLPLRDDEHVLLYQSVRELLINSVKHAKTCRACLSLSVDGTNQLQIKVRDDGAGFAVESLAATPSGAHFGLFSIRERMEAMGGTFQLDSAPGRGTTITLTLPLRHAVEPAPTSPAMPIRDRIPIESGPSRVLLVDDHAIIRQGLRTILEGHDDVLVIGEAGNGVEAVALAASMRPDIIVMDVNMPQMDGIQATNRIKAAHPDTLIVGLSVNNSIQIVEAMKQAGASAFLSKEAAPEELYKTMAALRSHACRSPTCL
jgi:signal transduction histidine kinase/ActR/RegA family two-component response regulator